MERATTSFGGRLFSCACDAVASVMRYALLKLSIPVSSYAFSDTCPIARNTASVVSSSASLN